MRGKKQMALLLALAALTAMFAVGFFLGRRTTPFEISAQVQRNDVPEEEPPENPPETDETPQISYPIDLNTATKEELMTLPRIGEKTAQKILDYREAYGRFAVIEQLMDVAGIGEATFEGLKDMVTVEEGQ